MKKIKMWQRVFLGAREFKVWSFMCVGSLAGVTYLRYTVLISPKKGETAVHCGCDPALSVLVMLVFRNVFHVPCSLLSLLSFNPLVPKGSPFDG